MPTTDTTTFLVDGSATCRILATHGDQCLVVATDLTKATATKAAAQLNAGNPKGAAETLGL
jgi:NAD(P)-dependent dehydrogenase (short-subunit alcohol dehydrogenase family)